jgi:hypothetical protein
MLEDDSSRKENNNNKKEFSVTEFSNSTTKKIKTSIYVFGCKVNLWIPKEFWEKWKELAKTEKLSASKLGEKAIIEYTRRHPVPNPQLLMSYYVKPEEPQPMRVLCIYCQGALTEGKVFCQKLSMWVPGVRCYGCKYNKLKKGEKLK